MSEEIDHELQSAIAMLRTAIDVLNDIRDKLNVQTPARVVFCSPVTGKIEAVNIPFGSDWFDATGYCKLYNSGNVSAYHTGVDLNRPNYLDSGAAVFAAADGVVKFCGHIQDWQGDIVVIEHRLEDGALIWTRYAHLQQLATYNASIRRGQQIGTIADYNRDGPRGDHLHFDVARLDLSIMPGDWPGQDKARVAADYIDPVAWLRERSK